MNLHAATDRRRQSSVSRAELRRILENCAIARPSDRDALRKQHGVVWSVWMFPQWNPLINPLQTVHRKQLLLCFGAMLFWTPGITN